MNFKNEKLANLYANDVHDYSKHSTKPIPQDLCSDCINGKYPVIGTGFTGM